MPHLLLTMWDTIKSSNIGILVAAGLGMFAIIGGLSMLSYHYTLSGIKSRTVGDGQHGTARWATDKEIRQTYTHVPFKVRDWRKGVNLPTDQGLVLGCKGKKDELTALVDSDDIHCFLPPDEEHPEERRHIVSVFKLVQDLLEPARGARGRSRFQLLMDKLPSEHKARWLAGAALNSSEQAMASVMSTVLSRLNSFLDSELEQILCFDSAIDAEMFAAEKSAIFLILPEEDQTKNFMAGLMIQNLSRELFAVADENGGKLKNRVILFCDELGTMPPFDILPLFSAGRSRRLTLVPIIQSLAQLEKNYGKEGASILMDNCQDVICGGFAPNSEAADTFSKALGSRTVLSGSVSRGKNDPSQSLQMMERPLLTADELKSIPKGSFIVQKTGCHPMRTRLRLFLEWGITFEEEYRVEEQAARRVYYADQNALTRAIVRKYPPKLTEQKTPRSVKGEGQLHDAPVQEMVVAEDIDYDRMPHKRAPYNLPRQEVDR